MHHGVITEIRIVDVTGRPTGGSQRRGGRRFSRWTLFFALLLAVVAARVPHHHWSWGLFVWGAAVGVAAVPANILLTRTLLRALPLSGPTHEAVTARLRARERRLYLPLVLLSLCFATYAAGRHTAWPDVMETIALLFAIGMPLWLLPKLRRRMGRQRRRTTVTY